MNKLHLLLTTALILAATGLKAQDACKEKVQTGTFISEAPGYEDYRIEREKNKQVEYFNNSKSKIISKVKWISEDEYMIIVKKHVNTPKSYDQMPGKYTFKVIDCRGNYHTLETVYEGQKMTFEMKKVK